MINTYGPHSVWKGSKVIIMSLALVSMKNVILLNSVTRFSPLVVGKSVQQLSWRSSYSIPPQQWLPDVDPEKITLPL